MPDIYQPGDTAKDLSSPVYEDLFAEAKRPPEATPPSTPPPAPAPAPGVTQEPAAPPAPAVEPPQEDFFKEAKAEPTPPPPPAADPSAPPVITPEETAQTNAIWEEMENRFGFERLEDQYRPKSFEELSGLLEQVIKENSVPQYANQAVEAFDRYVRAGGDPYTYLRQMGDTDYTNVRMETEYDQQMIVGRYLNAMGMDDNSIRASLEAYQKAGTLPQMAEGALTKLKDMSAAQKKQMVQEQERAHQQQEAANRKSIEDHVQACVGMNEIFGVKWSDADRKATLDYMFRQDEQGATAFAKDLFGDPKKAIMCAYILRNGEKALGSIQHSAQKSAAEKFRQTLARQSVMPQQMPSVKQSKDRGDDKPKQMWDYLPG